MNYFHKISNFISHANNYKNYRNLINTSKRPFIPYVGLLLKDIFFYDETLKTYNNENLINWDKFRKITSVLNFIKENQNGNYFSIFFQFFSIFFYIFNLEQNYPFEINVPLNQYLLFGFEKMEEKEAYTLSTKVGKYKKKKQTKK